MQNHAIKFTGHMGKMGLGYNAQKYFVSDILKKILKNDNTVLHILCEMVTKCINTTINTIFLF